jgi:hypothetical protein
MATSVKLIRIHTSSTPVTAQACFIKYGVARQGGKHCVLFMKLQWRCNVIKYVLMKSWSLLDVRTVFAVRACALRPRNFTFTTLRMNSTSSAVRVFRTNSLVRNIPNKIKHVLMKTQTKDVKSPSQSVKPGKVYESIRLCLGMNLVKDFTDFLTVLSFVPYMKIRAFWDVAPCSLAEVDRRFRGAYCLHRQGDG